MRPPIFAQTPVGTVPQQYLHLARMYRQAAIDLPAYVNASINWPAYFLLLHACELALKGFCKQCVANGQIFARASNHDLKSWYEIGRTYGLPAANQYTLDAFDILTELHRNNYARYPDNRRGFIPEISSLADDVVEWLFSVVSPVVQQGSLRR